MGGNRKVGWVSEITVHFAIDKVPDVSKYKLTCSFLSAILYFIIEGFMA
jgi:hypothetical protein